MLVEPLPARVTLKQNPWRFWRLGLAFVVIATLAVIRVPADMMTPIEGPRLRWGLGIGAAALLFYAFVSLRRTLVLDLEGFEWVGETRHEWRNCSEFSIEVTKVGKIRLHDVRATSSEGGDVIIWADFGMSQADLLALLNAFRQRALRQCAGELPTDRP